MNINIATQNVAAVLTADAAAQAAEINLHDATYGITITRTDAGYTVTDETGGDIDTPNLGAALTEAIDFIGNVADEDAAWVAVAAHLATI